VSNPPIKTLTFCVKCCENSRLLLVADLGRFVSARVPFLEGVEMSKQRIVKFGVVHATVSSILIVGSLKQLEPRGPVRNVATTTETRDRFSPGEAD
jgi:hypothetical protein